MQLFDIDEARHFCTPLPAHRPGVGQSLKAFHRTLPRQMRLVEGTTYFDVHRVSLLNAVERWILFGVADYRRALDMFIPSNAPWAQVTLYYSSFFAANAILGMFGAWLDHERLVDVVQGTPNSQILKIARSPRSPNGYPGSHRTFWDFFYEGCNAISPWVPTELQSAVSPVNNDRTWQIEARNEVNYDMHSAFDGARSFVTSFNPKKLRSLPGSLGQQLDVTENMLKLAIYFAKLFGVNSFAYQGIGNGSRSKVFRELVTKISPGLVTQSVLHELLKEMA
jgi:hypothetical protein